MVQDGKWPKLLILTELLKPDLIYPAVSPLELVEDSYFKMRLVFEMLMKLSVYQL